MSPLSTSLWFPVGRIVPAADLVGREEFLQEILARIRAGEGVVISAPRRTGKTSLTLEALRRLRSEGWLVAHVDLLRSPNEAQLAEQLLDAVLENETGVRRTLSKLRQLTSHIAGKLELKAQTKEGLELALAYAATPPDLEAALEAGNNLAERTNRTICIALDEFQRAPQLRPDAYAFIRSVLQHHQRAVYMFLGSQGTLLEQQFTRVGSPFWNFAVVRALPQVRPASWAAYLQRKFTEFGHPIDHVIAEEMAARSGGHPHCTMVLANQFLLALFSRRDLPQHLLLAAAYDAALDDLGATYDELYRSLAARSLAQETVLRLAREQPPYAAKADPTAVRRALQHLINQGIIRRRAKGSFDFCEAMFQAYLLRETDGP